jgi:hypothetical protein
LASGGYGGFVQHHDGNPSPRETGVNLIDNNIRPTFGGHEKFVFRHGWLKKGVDAVSSDPTIFNQDDGLVVLGVGKNMVRSIRHWCLATELLEDTGGTRSRGLQLAELGQRLVAEGGWDPYLEDPGTLWLLHWQLFSNRRRGLVWHLTFSSYFETEFTKKQLIGFIARHLERLGIVTTPALIESDIDCCLRTYVPPTRSKNLGISEEGLDCPLSELDLQAFVPDDGVYRFNVGPKVTLPTTVFGYALLRFLPSLARGRRTVTVDECIYHAESPGQAFKLDENSVIEHLEALETLSEGRVRVQETAGLRQLHLHQ